MNLSLDEELKNMKDLRNRYDIKCVMLHKNRFRVSLQAIRPKDLNVSGGKTSGDIMLNMMINEEELLNNLDEIKKAYNSYRELAINILVEYARTKPVEEMIVIYRDKMHFKWNDIAWLVHYSSRQVIRIYNECHTMSNSDDV